MKPLAILLSFIVYGCSAIETSDCYEIDTRINCNKKEIINTRETFYRSKK